MTSSGTKGENTVQLSDFSPSHAGACATSEKYVSQTEVIHEGFLQAVLPKSWNVTQRHIVQMPFELVEVVKVVVLLREFGREQCSHQRMPSSVNIFGGIEFRA